MSERRDEDGREAQGGLGGPALGKVKMYSRARAAVEAEQHQRLLQRLARARADNLVKLLQRLFGG